MRSNDQRQLTVDYKLTFNSEHGKRVLARLLREFGHFDRSTICAGDPQMSGFYEGQRYVVCCILRQLGKRPEDLPETVEEFSHE